MGVSFSHASNLMQSLVVFRHLAICKNLKALKVNIFSVRKQNWGFKNLFTKTAKYLQAVKVNFGLW